MGVSEDLYGVPGSKHNSPVEISEHAVISNVHGKKVFLVDNEGNQYEGTATLGLHVDPQPLSTLYHGTKTVPTGTAEVIASSQAIHSVTIKALSTNTVAVYVGASGVTTSGFELLPGESISLDVSNLNAVYVISGSASQVIRYIGL